MGRIKYEIRSKVKGKLVPIYLNYQDTNSHFRIKPDFLVKHEYWNASKGLSLLSRFYYIFSEVPPGPVQVNRNNRTCRKYCQEPNDVPEPYFLTPVGIPPAVSAPAPVPRSERGAALRSFPEFSSGSLPEGAVGSLPDFPARSLFSSSFIDFPGPAIKCILTSPPSSFKTAFHAVKFEDPGASFPVI